jgi:hypothetical protein
MSEIRRIQQQKQNKNKFRRIFRIQKQKQNKNKFRRIFLVYRYRWMSEIRRIQQQKQNKNKFRRIFWCIDLIRRNSAGTFCFVFVFVANLTHINQRHVVTGEWPGALHTHLWRLISAMIEV